MSNKSHAPEDKAIDFASDPIKTNILDCARHALVMEYRALNGSDPSPDELVKWAEPLLDAPDQLAPIVERRNRSIMIFVGKYPDFWAALSLKLKSAPHKDSA